MQHDLVLEGRVVTPGGIVETGVGISDGVVREIGRSVVGDRRIAAAGSLIFPGFVDIHVHMREPGWERKEDFRTGTSAAVHGGVTTLVDMPNNRKPADNPTALEEKSRLARQKGVVDVKFHGGVARDSLGALSKISGLVVGYKAYLSETTGAGPFPRSELGSLLRLVSATGKPLSVHCEDQGVIDRLKEKRGQGDGSYADSRPPEAETRSVRSVVASMEAGGRARVNVCHASTGETLSMVRRGRADGLALTCEATLHHLYYSRKAMETNPLLRTNPPLRSEEDRAGLVSGLKDGGASFLVTDHAPHLEEEKRADGLAGVPGLDDYAHVVSWLIKSQGVDPVRVAEVAAAAPARHIGLRDRGEVRPGARADLVVIDLRAPVKVRNDDVKSKCGWSPYEGIEFPGRARWVLSRGEVLMDDFEQAV